jgi:hypothetical protein
VRPVPPSVYSVGGDRARPTRRQHGEEIDSIGGVAAASQLGRVFDDSADPVLREKREMSARKASADRRDRRGRKATKVTRVIKVTRAIPVSGHDTQGCGSAVVDGLMRGRPSDDQRLLQRHVQRVSPGPPGEWRALRQQPPFDHLARHHCVRKTIERAALVNASGV